MSDYYDILHKEYDVDSLCDLERDVYEALQDSGVMPKNGKIIVHIEANYPEDEE